MLNPISEVGNAHTIDVAVNDAASTRFARGVLASDSMPAEFLGVQRPREKRRVITIIPPTPRPYRNHSPTEGDDHLRDLWVRAVTPSYVGEYERAAEPVLYVIGGEIEPLGGVVDEMV